MKRVAAFIKDHPETSLAALGAILAFVLRYWYFWRYPYPLMLHEQDGIAYMQNARDMLSFKAPGNLFMPPFYSLVIAAFSILPVKFEIAARLASITMDSLLAIPLYGISRILLPRGASLAVCFLWSTFSFSLFFTPSPLSQSTYLCMLLTGIYLLYRALEESNKTVFFALAGVCLSCAYLTRPEGFVSIGIALVLTAAGAFRRGTDRRAYLKGGIVLLGAFFLTAFPYLLMLRGQFGHWTFTAKTVVAIKGIDGSLTIGAGKDAVKNGLTLWLEAFGGLSGGLKFIFGNAVAFYNLLLNTFASWTHLLALIGILFIFIARNFYNRLFLLFPVLMTIPVYVANLPKVPSYIYPLFPFVMIAFVACIWGVISMIMHGIGKIWAGAPHRLIAILAQLLLALPVVFLGVNGCRDATANYISPEYLFQVEQTNKVFKAAGADINAASGPKDLLMTRWGLVSYFAERPLMVMPKGSIEDVLAAGRKAGARLILIDEESVTSRRQELKELLGPLYGVGINPRYGLEVVAVRATSIGGYVVYRYL
jgi:hypothetical protein